jgi:cytochrome c-type biogenesis protein CcmH/NrfF
MRPRSQSGMFAANRRLNVSAWRRYKASALILWCCIAATARAGTPDPPVVANPEAAVRRPSADADAAALALGSKLRCPVCQGMPIAESPATMAVDMMQRVRQMQAAGRNDAEIIEYFTARYGQWVLLDPPRTGFALWVWALPPLLLLATQATDDLLAAVRQEVDQ